MPIRPPRTCKHGGCFAGTTAANGLCDKHQGDDAAADKARKDADPYRHLSNRKLWRVYTRDSVMMRCGGFCERIVDGKRCTQVATDIHHVVKADKYIKQHGGDEDAYFDEANLRGVCASCHQWLTVGEREGRDVTGCFGPPPESTWSPCI